MCYKVNLSLLKYQAFQLSNQQEVISLCESCQHKKTIVVQQSAGLKALWPALRAENSLGHTKISRWYQPRAEGQQKNSLMETTLGMRIFLPQGVSRCLLHRAAPAQLLSKGTTAMPC